MKIGLMKLSGALIILIAFPIAYMIVDEPAYYLVPIGILLGFGLNFILTKIINKYFKKKIPEDLQEMIDKEEIDLKEVENGKRRREELKRRSEIFTVGTGESNSKTRNRNSELEKNLGESSRVPIPEINSNGNTESIPKQHIEGNWPDFE